MFGLLSRILWGMPARTDDSLTRVELARLEGTVSALVRELQAMRETVDNRFSDHESRIRTNERWRLTMPPTLLTSVAALVLTIWHH